LAAAAMRRLMKPGPATSTDSISPFAAGLTRSASAIALATSRGFFFRVLATCSATLHARSPCASTLGRFSVGRTPATPMPASACSISVAAVKRDTAARLRAHRYQVQPCN
jgi:hypothetical protein